MKFLILSYADDTFAPVTDITYPNKLEYAQRHGYDVILARDTPDHVIRGDDPPSWAKLEMILRAFEKPLLALFFDDTFRRLERGTIHNQEWDYLIWTDADSIFTDMKEPLGFHDLGADFVFTSDENGLNCGVFMVKNSPDAYRILLSISSMVEFKTHMWWEQGAFQKYLKVCPDDRGRFFFVPKFTINAYPREYPMGDWKEGDFILHVPGGSPADKVRYLTPYLNRIIR